MSPPDRIWAAENKLFQLRAAAEAGFSTPPTLASNDPARIREAYRRFGGRMIVKPLRSGYVEIHGEPQAVFTNQVLAEHLDQVEAAKLCPAIYQPLVEKRCDVRVTYVDGELFVAEIDSQTDPEALVDWRHTSNPELPHRLGTLPTQLALSIREFMKRLGLVFGALDFIRTPDEGYVFLEVNPNGQWLWIEEFLDLPISAAIARWLAEKARGAKH